MVTNGCSSNASQEEGNHKRLLWLTDTFSRMPGYLTIGHDPHLLQSIIHSTYLIQCYINSALYISSIYNILPLTELF